MESGAVNLVDDWRAITPDVYETDFAMHRGHTPAFAGSPLSTLLGRQPELTRYRTPIDGLYLSGAATYPGAGIFGAAGRNTAATVERDLRHPLGRRLQPLRQRLRPLSRWDEDLLR
jgi:phytoene dehydrogenase-like protein